MNNMKKCISCLAAVSALGLITVPAGCAQDRPGVVYVMKPMPFYISGQVGGDSLTGKIGNGGCTLSLTNSNGSIEILKLMK